jgi:hypothetical protein
VDEYVFTANGSILFIASRPQEMFMWGSESIIYAYDLLTGEKIGESLSFSGWLMAMNYDGEKLRCLAKSADNAFFVQEFDFS